MAPRKRKTRTLEDALAANLRRLREGRTWTQAYLAEEMMAFGFNWSRLTVTEVERETPSRRRKVTVPELVALAIIFDVGVPGLLWGDASEDAPLDVAGDLSIPSRTHLVAAVATLKAMQEATSPVLAAQFEARLTKVLTEHFERVRFMADEMRSLANYFEQEAVARFKEGKVL